MKAVFLLAGLLAAGDRLLADQATDCLVELRIPQYPSLARQARLTGKATVSVIPGTSGKAADVIVDGVHKLLTKTLLEAIGQSRFDPNCAGRNLEYIFVFDLFGPPQSAAAGYWLFRAPNVFVLRSPYFPISR